MTTPVSSTAGTIYDPKTGTTKASDPNKDRDNFLLLLTTQLKNQDPTNPTDTNQVTQQIALLSQVEQQTKSNTLLQQLVNSYGQSQTDTAVNYIGRSIEAAGNTSQLSGGTTTFAYDLPANTNSATITISDSAGKVVYSGDAPTATGHNTFTWNGKNSKTGAQQADGAYTYAITAKDTSGKDATATTYSTGVVQSVSQADGVTTLSLGNFSVPLTSVSKVVNSFSQSQANTAVNYIGRVVQATGNTSQLSGGKATFVYNLPANTTSATVTISDSTGKTVYTGSGTTIAGRNTVIWDGSDTKGEQMKDGAYTFSVVAKDAQSKAVTATTFSTGIVQSVDQNNGVTSLSLGNFSIPLDSVISVYNPTVSSAA